MEFPIADRGLVQVVRATVWALSGDDTQPRVVTTLEELQEALRQGWGSNVLVRYVKREKCRWLLNQSSGDIPSPMSLHSQGARWLLHRKSWSRQLVERWVVSGIETPTLVDNGMERYDP